MVRKLANLTIACAALFALGTLSGCVGTASAQGLTSLYVQDAPADGLSHLYVTFSQVQVHQMANRSAERNETDTESERPAHDNVTGGTPNGTGKIAIDVSVQDDDGSDDGHWITVESGNVTVDLKALNASAAGFLGDANVPVGNYNSIRLTVVDAQAVWQNNTTQPVKVPGHALRINGFFTVAQGQETRLTLDVDLSRSLVQLGNGDLLLKPVIHMDGEHRGRMGDGERHRLERERDDESRRERRMERND